MKSYAMATVVVDNGSFQCKVGFAAMDRPVETFLTVVGRHKRGGVDVCGDQAMEKSDLLYNKVSSIALR